MKASLSYKLSAIGAAIGVLILGFMLGGGHTGFNPDKILVSLETPLTSEQFQRLTYGKTLSFSENGKFYGAESFHANNRVTWFDEESCVEGIWAQRDDLICFIYTDDTSLSCWQFFEDNAQPYMSPNEGQRSQNLTGIFYHSNPQSASYEAQSVINATIEDRSYTCPDGRPL